MITSLSIKNYALIEDIQVDFTDGFTIITGETGSGKSILIEGLSLILGARADLTSIRDLSKKCVIEGNFSIKNYNLEQLFAEEDIDYDVETIIRREILPSGKSRAFVNDSPVNLSILSQIGNKLIDIHSQHQNLQLANSDFQFQVIDALAENEQSLIQYQSTLLSYKTLRDELERLQELKSEALKEQDYNAFLWNELNEAELVPGEIEELENEYRSLNNLEVIKEKLSSSFALLDSEDFGILERLNLLRNELKSLSDMSTTYHMAYERVNSALIDMQDVLSDMERSKDQLESDPNRVHEINSKLNVIHNLLLKHSAANIQELLEIREELSKKVNAFEDIDDEILRKQNVFNSKEKELNSLAKNLHKKREKAVPLLKDHLQDILSNLGMPNARFEMDLQMINTFNDKGRSSLNILFSANKGSLPKPLRQVASGGEISRIMLAIKSILANYMHLPTIIFDEIDLGVSGEISSKIGEIMKQMSETMQVFTITHLPQVAAKGDAHFKVFKEVEEDQTSTKLKKLKKEERIVEIAQMLSGEEMTTSAIAHAKQLLN